MRDTGSLLLAVILLFITACADLVRDDDHVATSEAAGAVLIVEPQPTSPPGGRGVLACARRSGMVRTWDAASNQCGYLSLDASDWTVIGNPRWNDRMDQFGNDDDGRQRTMCLYQHINYTGARVALPLGYMVTWDNIVSSNRWATGC